MNKSNKGPVLLFSDRLRMGQEQAATAMENYVPGGITVPENVYLAREQCKLAESQSSGNLMISREFTVVEGDYTGMRIWDNIVFENNSIGWQQARRWVEQHGYEWPETDMAQLETIILEINAASPMVKVRNKHSIDKKDPTVTYTNVSVLEIIGEGEAAAAQETQQTAGTEEVQTEVAAEGEGDVLSDMNRNDLKKFITENSLEIKVTPKMTDENIREAIRALYAEADSGETEEAPAEEVADEVNGYDAQTLLVFAASQGIGEVQEGMAAADILEVLKTYQYKEVELQAEEITMLNAIGVAANIIPKPAPKPAATASKPGLAKPGLAKPGLSKPAPTSAPKAAPAAKPGLAKPGLAKPGLKK